MKKPFDFDNSEILEKKKKKDYYNSETINKTICLHPWRIIKQDQAWKNSDILLWKLVIGGRQSRELIKKLKIRQ